MHKKTSHMSAGSPVILRLGLRYVLCPVAAEALFRII